MAGGRVEMGTLEKKAQFKLLRNGEEVARGHIEELQMAKSPTNSVTKGNEFGMMVDCKVAPEAGDIIETFKTETK